jgi:hypothetical protein
MNLKKVAAQAAIAGALGFSAIGLAGVANAAPAPQDVPGAVHYALADRHGGGGGPGPGRGGPAHGWGGNGPGRGGPDQGWGGNGPGWGGSGPGWGGPRPPCFLGVCV